MLSGPSHTKKPNFQLQYAQIQHTLTTAQALRAVLGYHKPIDRIKQTLQQISKSEAEINLIGWRDQKGKVKFIALCQEVYDFMENKESQSRREIGEMNSEILKMQKSLTGLGIQLSTDETQKAEETGENKKQMRLLNFKEEKSKSDTQNKEELKQQKITEEKRENNVDEAKIDGKGNEKQTSSDLFIEQKHQQSEKERNQKQITNEQNQNIKKQQKNQLHNCMDLVTVEKVEKQKQRVDESHQDFKQHKIQDQNMNQKEEEAKQALKEHFNNENEKKEKPEWPEHQQGAKQQKGIEENPKQQKQETNEINSEIQRSLTTVKLQELKVQPFCIESQPYTAGISRVKITEENQSDDSKVKMIFSNKLKLSSSQMGFEQKQKAKEISTKWTEIILQNKTLHKRSLSLGTNLKKKFTYNPYEEISKYECRKRHKCEEPPKNQLQSLHQKYRKRLRELFPYLLKQMKSSALTFDGYPNSLNINSFSSFLKNFNLNGICTPKQVLLHFKKYAINGIWLNQEGFLGLIAKILGLPQTMTTFTDGVKAEKQKYAQLVQQFEEGEMQINEFQNDKRVEKKRKIKEKELNRIQKETEEKESDLMEKLRQINAILSSKQGNRFIAKGDNFNQNYNFYPERLKKIVDAHSGICPQDVFEQFHLRKRQNERLNELKAKKIIQKYQVKDKGKSQVQIGGLNRNMNSLPNIHMIMHKVEGLSKITSVAKDRLQSVETKKGKRLKSEPKHQQKKFAMEVDNEEREDDGNKRTAEFDKKRSSSKISKKQKRNQSILDSQNKIQTGAILQTIKSLIQEANQRVFEEFYSQQKMIK